MDRGLDEADIGGVRMNPRLHIVMHELVANQLWHNDPAEVWETGQRLRGLGYDRHEILHMLAAAMSEEMWQALRDRKPYDKRRHLAGLRALPESWEKERGESPRGKPSVRPAWRPKPVIGHGKRKRHR